MFPAPSVNTEQTPRSLQNVTAEFDAAAEHLALDNRQTAYIREPRASTRFKLPLRRDDSSVQCLKAYHSVHSVMCGPAIGGIQFRPAITQEMVEALAFWATHRCALLGIPFGGCAGAIEGDPADFSAGELERLSRQYALELSQHIHPNASVLTADIGTNQQTMCWIMDTYSMNRGAYTPAVVLGKPVDLGGAAGSEHSTAIGAELCVRKACNRARIDLHGARIAIQGFGKVGARLAQSLAADGARIVGIADITGAYVNDEGIPVREMVWHQQSYGLLDGVESEVDVHKLDDPLKLLSLPVDVLILAAVELQITEENVDDVRARVVAEVAHDPVSPGADQRLFERNVLVIPDILCNAGGVAGHYCEWAQDRLGYYWTPERMRSEIQTLVGNAFDRVIALSDRERLSLRFAAATLAVQRVADTARLRGYYA